MYRRDLGLISPRERRSRLKVCTRAVVGLVNLEPYGEGVGTAGAFFHSIRKVEFTIPISDSLHYLLSNPLHANLEFLKYLSTCVETLSDALHHDSTFLHTHLLRDDLKVDLDGLRNIDTFVRINRPYIEYMYIHTNCVSIKVPRKCASALLMTLEHPSSDVGLEYLAILDYCAPLCASVLLALRVSEGRPELSIWEEIS
ncbi:hypothetical protein BD309DRAFT_1018924 [Dichomitus squalens]|uniref:Uncharacterized protein n=1 Tax=Dichomitus squalens TaxID=114155 RepID=A0A4Q9ML64_9APHY|nr:hypothetical protein BD311DRAFT_806998 [Dichomitus squalens]TBU43933.1 hypothetical protein BD309DRAFT_1018924 [Dichomitus squalens]TBU53728.1 hypothetical protein BD310DRAFT_1042230 [Dichomitus squalens]